MSKIAAYREEPHARPRAASPDVLTLAEHLRPAAPLPLAWLVESRPFPAPSPAPEHASRARLARDLRRIWMSAAFRKADFALLLCTLRPASAGRPAPSGSALVLEGDMLSEALEAFGAVHRLGATTFSVVLPEMTAGEAARIAEAVRRALDARHAAAMTPAPLFAAGISTFFREEDPAVSLRLAEERLARAVASGESAVIPKSAAEVFEGFAEPGMTGWR